MRATASDGAWQQLATSLVLSGVVILVLWAATYTRPWIAVDNKFFDLLTSLSAPYQSTLPVVILAIDEPSFAELKTQWPFPRRMHAQVLNRLRADGARAVGFDVVFAEASNPADDLALAQAIATAPPLVLGAARELTESGNATLWSEVAPLAAFVRAGAVPGQTLVRPDDDFVVRRLERSPDAFAMRVAIASGATLAAAPPSSEAMIGYQGPRGTFDTRSYYQALEPGLLPEGFFRDKVVLIGRSVRTSTELRRSQADLFNSPFALVDQEDRLLPGIEVQANQLANLMLGDSIEPLDVRWQMALLVALSVLFVLLSSQLHPGMVAGMTAALATSVLMGTFWLFAVQKLWMPPLLPLLALVSLYGSTQLLHGMATRRRAQQIRAMFSQYVPADVVAQLIDNPALFKLGGEVRELTLMFTDLANFTAMSEHLSAPATVDVLTEYFNTMTDIIHRHGGTVDKFIGDAVMAFWGAPVPDAQHAEHAVRAAIDMQAAMHALTQRLLARGLPRIAMRIGLHSGKVVVGNVGSHRRFSYTAIGDAVNLAARLEGANKAFGSGILLSEATAAGLPAELSLRHLDTVVVKGKSQSIKVFSPCDDGVLRQLSALGIASFQQQQWETSASAFTQLLAYQPGDMAALRFLQRIEQLRATPPDATWQAALVLDKL